MHRGSETAAALLVVRALDLAATVVDAVLPPLRGRLMDDPVKKPSAPADVDWTDIVYDLVHVVHELALADITRLREVREAMIKRGIAVPPLADPDEDR